MGIIRAVRHLAARLALYGRRGGSMAGVLSPSVVPFRRRGAQALPWLVIVFAADRGVIISAYQTGAVSNVSLSEEVQWLR
ncbi:MAG: hypothetical protein ACR2PL_22060 [Dehalococcoidia bacterium]